MTNKTTAKSRHWLRVILLLLITGHLSLVTPLPAAPPSADVRIDGNGNVLNAKAVNFATGKLKVNGVVVVGGAGGSGGEIDDGDKGDITVSSSGTVWLVDSGAIPFSELSGTATWAQVSKTGSSLADLATRNFSDLQSKPTTIAGYGIVDAFTQAAADALYSPLAHVHTFASLTSKPTTIAGYGIVDAFDGAFSSLTGKPTTLSGYGITDAQPVDADLTSISAASSTDVLYYRSGAGTWSTVTIGPNMAFSGGTLSSSAGTGGTATIDTVTTLIKGDGLGNGIDSGIDAADVAELTDLPANTTSTSSQFFTAYNSTTHAFTKAQPAFSDISGTATWAQVSKTGSSLADLATRNFSDLQSTPTTIAGYGITDFNSLGDARWSLLAHTHTFASLTSKPTTLSGYGITDAEPALGNPGTSGFILSSTTGGVRSWVAAGSGDASTNTSSSVDSEVVLFSGTGGKTLKRATQTGIAKVTAGVLSAVTAPSGIIVGTTDTQNLTNKTLTNPSIDTATVTDSINGIGFQTAGVGKSILKAATTNGSNTSFTLPFIASGSDSLLSLTSTNTLTNKSISGSTNTFTNIGTAALSNSAVTYAKIQNVSTFSKLLGSGSAGGGAPPGEITLGTNLTMTGTTLNANSGTGGDFSSNTSTSVDNEILLFSGTAGKTGKRATQTGVLKATSGVLSAATAGTDYLAPAAIGVTVQAFDADLSSLGAASGTGTIYYRSAANTWAPVTIGANLTFTSGTLAATGGGGGGNVATDTIWNAKGDLAIGTGADTAARLAVGANGTVPVADSTQTTGIKWDQPVVDSVVDPTSGFALNFVTAGLTADRTVTPANAASVTVVPASAPTGKVLTGIGSDGNVISSWATVNTPATITANQNNYNPGSGAKYQRWSTDASRNVTGMTFTTAQTSGQEHVIVDVGAQNIVLVNESASSTAANRFHNSTGADITLAANQEADVWYDGITLRWRASKRN